MQKRVNVVTPGALPCPFSGVRIALMDHLHNQMTMQAHRWFAVDKLRLLHHLSHDSALLYFCKLEQFRFRITWKRNQRDRSKLSTKRMQIG